MNGAVLFGDESRNPLGYMDKAQRDIAACIDLLHAKLGQDPALSRCDFSAVNIPSFTQGAEDLRSSRRLHVLGIEVQVARTTTEFENFCTKKIMRKIVAVRARAVSPELEPVLPDLLEPRVVASRISSLTGHCRRSVMFTPIASGVGIDWVVGFREDRDWALRAVARVLQVLQSVHKLGITLNGRAPSWSLCAGSPCRVISSIRSGLTRFIGRRPGTSLWSSLRFCTAIASWKLLQWFASSWTQKLRPRRVGFPV